LERQVAATGWYGMTNMASFKRPVIHFTGAVAAPQRGIALAGAV